jgi:hypothetical protein
MTTKNRHLLYNLLFVLFCGLILLFLLTAPPETTPPLPHDDNHRRFMSMKKKRGGATLRTLPCSGQGGALAGKSSPEIPLSVLP